MTATNGKRKLAQVLRTNGDLITVSDVANSLDIDSPKAHQLLSRWAKQGMLKRVSRGLYAHAPLESIESEHAITDPWIMIPALFDPCYVGSRTATEYWDLTEQIFRDFVVFTATPQRSTRVQIHGATFTLKKVSDSDLFGTKVVWRGRTKVMVSDLHKTIVDILAYPDLGGGIQHVSDCLRAYFAHEEHDPRKLLEYAKQANNGAIFKRLGYLVDKYFLDPMLADACRSNLTTGLAKLDPALQCSRVVSKWRIRIPDSWAKNK
jgi:predicted transcriptional regulator of viral defense system